MKQRTRKAVRIVMGLFGLMMIISRFAGSCDPQAKGAEAAQLEAAQLGAAQLKAAQPGAAQGNGRAPTKAGRAHLP